MPLEVCSSADALNITHANKAFREWPNRREKNRVEPLAQPNFRPSFQLLPGEKVFTIGSCFARNIEAQLERLRFDVVVRRLLDDPVIREDDALIGPGALMRDVPSAPGMINKYTPHSILNELRWALEPDRAPYPDPGAYYEMGSGEFCDANMINASAASLDRLRLRRKIVLENVSAVRECRVIIITPGLVETWWDDVLKDYVNHTPPIAYLRKQPDRFQLHVLNYDEVRLTYEEIHSLLARHLPRDFRIIFTVSPVPLQVTFRDMDVMVANSYSKSVLRAAAEDFCMRHDNVDYFPSYESLIYSNRLMAWEDDLVHPTEAVVKANVYRMIKAYLSIEGLADDPCEPVDRDAGFEISHFSDNLARVREELASLRAESHRQTRHLKQVETQYELQKELLKLTQEQLKRSQDTTARYLRQILERDGLIQPT